MLPCGEDKVAAWAANEAEAAGERICLHQSRLDHPITLRYQLWGEMQRGEDGWH